MAVSLNIENVLSLPLSDSYYTSNLPSSDIRQLVNPRIEISQLIESTSSGRFEVFNNGLLSIKLEQTMMMGSYHVVDELRIKNVVSGIEQVMGVAMMQQMSLCIGYDETTHVTYYIFGGKDPWGSWNQIHKYDSSGWSSTIKEALYEAIIGSIPVLYNWSSVPAISGKNGILTLSTAENSYHTGEAVTNIPISDVSLSAPSRLSTLAAVIPNGETVSVVYAGSIDHMDITPQVIQYTISLILAGQAVYTITPTRFPRWLGFIIDEENEVAKLVWYTEHREADILTGYNEVPADATAEEMHDIWRWIHSHIEEENPEDNEPDDGTGDDYQPDIGITGIEKPTSGAYDTGFTTQYRMSDTQLKSLAQYLWSSSFVDNVKKFFNDPREIIVGLTLMPVLPDTGTSKEVKAGGISTGVYGLPLTDQYKLDTYGSITIKK